MNYYKPHSCEGVLIRPGTQSQTGLQSQPDKDTRLRHNVHIWINSEIDRNIALTLVINVLPITELISIITKESNNTTQLTEIA